MEFFQSRGPLFYVFSILDNPQGMSVEMEDTSKRFVSFLHG